VKVIEKSKTSLERLDIEIDIMRRIGHHPNIVELYDVYDDEKTHQLKLVMEYLTGGELFDKLCKDGAYSEKEASSVARCMGEALKFLHEHNIVHRDLKPENLLLVDDNPGAVVKLADFGLAKVIQTNVLETVCGTWAYAAPEVKGQLLKQEKGYTNKVDVWSLGVIIYVLISGYHPFDPEGEISDEDMQFRINQGQYDFDDEVWTDISDDAKDLIRKCLQVAPENRLDVYGLLGHKWIGGDGAPSAQLHPKRMENLKRTQMSDASKRKWKAGIDAVRIGVMLSHNAKSE
jgi:serine/threonine protein kinase